GSGTGSGRSGTDATTVFRSARDLITDGDWARAQEKFSEYVNSFPNEKNIDAALYWLAYTQNKLAKYDQCRTTVERLREKYPNASWKEDARVLLAQVPVTTVAAYEDMISAVRAQAVAAAKIQEQTVYAPAAPITITPAPVAMAAPAIAGYVV